MEETQTSYVYALNRKYAKVEGIVMKSTEIVYYHHNNLGSTRVMTNQDGEKVFDQDYLPFGGDLPKPNQLEVKNETGESYKYTGQKQVESIGLYYYKARYYDPAIGRFNRQDSYRGKLKKPQSQHLYVYVLNNPLKYTDPTGHINKEAGKGRTKGIGINKEKLASIDSASDAALKNTPIAVDNIFKTDFISYSKKSKIHDHGQFNSYSAQLIFPIE